MISLVLPLLSNVSYELQNLLSTCGVVGNDLRYLKAVAQKLQYDVNLTLVHSLYPLVPRISGGSLLHI